MDTIGTVTELHRWPVKSMAGEPVDALAVDRRGACGDRTHAVYDTHKDAPRRLTARQSPRLLAWRAAYPGRPGGDVAPEDPPEPVLRSPDGAAWQWADAGLPAALGADLGRKVTLHSDAAGQQDLPDSLLVTTQATLDAVAGELEAPLDLRRFRTNIHVELDVPAFAEEGWEGRRLSIGEAELDLLHPCRRCVIPTRDPDSQEKWAQLLRHLFAAHSGRFGINARAQGRATIRRGDPVWLH